MTSVTSLQQIQSSNLMAVLQTEMNMEASRVERLQQVLDPQERTALIKLLDKQREEQRLRIEKMVSENQKAVRDRVGNIVKYRVVAEREVPDEPQIKKNGKKKVKETTLHLR